MVETDPGVRGNTAVSGGGTALRPAAQPCSGAGSTRPGWLVPPPLPTLSAAASPGSAPPLPPLAVWRQQAGQAGDRRGDPGAAVHQPGRADKGGHPHRQLPLPRQLSASPDPVPRPALQRPYRLAPLGMRSSWRLLEGPCLVPSLFVLFCEHPSAPFLYASCSMPPTLVPTTKHNASLALCGHIGPVLLHQNVKNSLIVQGQCFGCRPRA